MTVTILHGDCRTTLKELPERSVQCVVTSPPYWGLRDYGVDGQIGLEGTPHAYVAALVEVFTEVWRVLDDTGTLWLNLGDSYASPGKYGKWDAGRARNLNTGIAPYNYAKQANRLPNPDLKEKDLVGIPWRMAFALQDTGWYLRSDIIWHKPNPMPESVTDRPTKAHEYLFLLTKSAHYYYNAAAIAEPAVSDHGSGNGYKREARVSYQNADGTARGNDTPWSPKRGHASGLDVAYGDPVKGQQRHGLSIDTQTTRNRRSVWTVATKPYPGAHFAVMPEALVEPCILAGSRPGDTVLDPFGGSGTVSRVATKHGRNSIYIDLNADYISQAEQRTDGVQTMMEVA